VSVGQARLLQVRYTCLAKMKPSKHAWVDDLCRYACWGGTLITVRSGGSLRQASSPIDGACREQPKALTSPKLWEDLTAPKDEAQRGTAGQPKVSTGGICNRGCRFWYGTEMAQEAYRHEATVDVRSG
jgi:hypothetical protein